MAANIVVFQGNLVRTPEFANTGGDNTILNFTVAHSRKYKKKEDVTFLDCVAYGNTAENIGKFFDKGDPIVVTGRLLQNNWQDRDNNKRSKIILTVEQFHFAGQTGNQNNNQGGGQSNRNQNRNSQGSNNRNQGSNQNNNNQNQNSNGGNNYNNNNQGGGRNEYQDDIPF